MAGRVVLVESTPSPFEQLILIGPHQFAGDEPVPIGADAGPNPYELLLAALGTCTSMTLEAYARRKRWPLERVIVRLTHARVHADDCAHEDDPTCRMDRIERKLTLFGAGLTAEQRARLKEIAERCPVHKTLTGKLDIRTELVEPP
jgi:putative redox protein